MCDIGAGPGDLAQCLAAEVETYVAVESRSDYAATLRGMGLSVIERPWPTPLDRQFDGVVMSHVLRSGVDVQAMVTAAIDALTPDGALFVVLHAIEGSEWQRLMQQLDMAGRLEDDLTRDVESVLTSRGLLVRRRELRSRVSTKTAEALTSALSFVASAGEPEAAQQFVSRLRSSGFVESGCRRADGSYTFDLELRLLVAERASTNGREGEH